MSIIADHRGGGRPRRHPPTATQCALAVVTAGLAVATVMLALVETAQASYVDPLPAEETLSQSSVSTIPLPTLPPVQTAPTSTPSAAKATCTPVVPSTYSGTVRVDGEPAADALTLTASIDGQAWATAVTSDGRYTISIPQHTPETPPCFPGNGTILFTLDGYTCMPAEEQDGTQWVACGYHSFTPGFHDVDFVCLAMPTPTPAPDDASRTAPLIAAGLDGHLQSSTAYQQFSQAQPESSSAARSAFLSGLIPYLIGDSAAARTAWEEMLDAFPSPEHRAQAHLWLAKLDLLFLDDSEGASDHLEQAVAAAPDSFYALQAEAWLEDQGAAPISEAEDTIQTPAAPDWDAVEGWLISFWGPETLAAGPSPFDLPAWERGQEFHQLGLTREATNEFLSLIDQSSLQPWSLYRLARAFNDLDMPHLAAAAAAPLLAKVGGPVEQSPRALLELSYPLAYPSLIQATAAENDLSPLLLLAVIRQESFFNPLAVSPAGALGLTQVMPSTAQGIAAELNVADFSTADLLQPQVSIQFGARYLRSQLDAFAGNPYFALAAYNAGPDNATRWSQSLPISDMDLFVEIVDFAETRSYVKLVLENYAVYRFLYGVSDHPSLLSSSSS
jgi:soluble lytic murein transglycosylase-like protein